MDYLTEAFALMYGAILDCGLALASYSSILYSLKLLAAPFLTSILGIFFDLPRVFVAPAKLLASLILY